MAQALADTLKRISDDNRVVETLDRKVICCTDAQTFKLTELTSALSSALTNGTAITDES